MDTPITPATPATQTRTAPTVTPHVEPHTKASVSDSEAATIQGWIKDDLAKGKMTQAQADAAFTELNAPIEQRGPDTRTDEQKELDHHFSAAKPEDYRITYGDPGQDPPEMTPELKQFDQSARRWMSSAGFPRDTGNSLVAAIDKTVQATQHMTADQLETYGYREFEKLQKAHGAALEERLQSAALMIHELDVKQPSLKNLLKSRGIGDSAMVANMLIAHAAIYQARRKGR